MDVWIIKETCLDRDYERSFVQVENGWTVVDVGAGLGDFTVLVGRRCPDSTIFAFEPLPESYDLLLANLALNRLANVRTIPAALAGTSGTLQLSSRAGLAERSRTHPDPGDGPTVPVPAIGLEQAFERFGIRQCDFLKMDCEGAEYDILFGAPEDALRRIRRIAMEYHEGVTRYGCEDLVRLLEKRGFVVETRPNPAHRDIGFLFATRGDAAQRAT
jgi:FkbM family methyltransferase